MLFFCKRKALLRLFLFGVIVSLLITSGYLTACQSIQNLPANANNTVSTLNSEQSLTSAEGSGYFDVKELVSPMAIDNTTQSINQMIVLQDKVLLWITGTMQTDNHTTNVLQKLIQYNFSGERLEDIILEDLPLAPENLKWLCTDNQFIYLLYYQDQDNTFSLLKLSIEGSKFTIEKQISLTLESFPNNFTVDKQGNFYFLSSSYIEVYTKDGKPLFQLEDRHFGNNLVSNGQEIWVDYFSEEKQQYYLAPIDVSTQKLGEMIPLDSFDTNTIMDSNLGSILLINDVGLYQLENNSIQPQLIFKWDSINIPYYSNTPPQLAKLTDGNFFALTEESSNRFSALGESVLYSLSPMEVNPNVAKTELVLGGIGISNYKDLVNAITEFNRTHPNIRIKTKDYQEMVVEKGSLDQAMKEISLEIMSGTGPDLFAISNSDYMLSLVNQGLLTDIYRLMEQDSSFSRDDYLDNVFKMLETDGKLYRLTPAFFVGGCSGLQSILGERTGWTFDEFSETANGLPKNMTMLKDVPQEKLFGYFLYAGSIPFIDSQLKTANFNNPFFYQALEFAKTYGAVLDPSLSEGDRPSMEEYIKNREQALNLDTVIGSPNDYLQLMNLFGGDISILGYPSAQAKSPLFGATVIYGIFAKSPHQQEAWIFLKNLLSSTQQEKLSQSNMIPVLKTAFENQIQIVKGSPELGKMMTADTEEAYRKIFQDYSFPLPYDYNIQYIIEEESAAYFAGDKTAQEVAKIIQNRVQTLLDEQAN